MKKILLLTVFTILCIAAKAQFPGYPGQIASVSNTTTCTVGIVPFCLDNGTTTNACNWLLSTWTGMGSTLNCPGSVSTLVGDNGIFAASCAPTDVVFYKVCWNTPQCTDCVWIFHPSAQGQLHCTNTMFGIGATPDFPSTGFLKPCDCCPAGADVSWIPGTNRLLVQCH